MFELHGDYCKIKAAMFGDNLIELSIPYRGHTADSATILNLDQAKLLTDKLTGLINDIHTKLRSNKAREKSQEKLKKLEEINEQLLTMYREDNDVESELDAATDSIGEAIDTLRNKYGL